LRVASLEAADSRCAQSARRRVVPGAAQLLRG